MASDLFDGLDEGVKLERPMAPMPMKMTFVDWRSSRGQIRVSRSGEDGDMAAWTALFACTPIALLDEMYRVLRGQPVYFNLAVSWLEAQREKETKPPAPPAAVDWIPRLRAFLDTQRPTATQAAAIAHLRQIAIDRGAYSIDLSKAVRGIREVLPEIHNGTVAAVLGKDKDIIRRLVAKGFLK